LTAWHFGTAREQRFPRLSLTGMTLGEDDAPALYNEKFEWYRFDPNLTGMPESEPGDREQLGREFQSRVTLLEAQEDRTPGAQAQKDSLIRTGFAFAVTGTSQRGLAEEVAKAEIAVVRHSWLLRTTLLRYFKAIALVGFTALLFAATAAARRAYLGTDFAECRLADADLAAALCCSIAFVGLWGLGVVSVIRLPLKTIGLKRITLRRSDFTVFENRVKVAAALCGTVALVGAVSVAIAFSNDLEQRPRGDATVCQTTR
jgi:hypothetical protein